MVVFHRACNAAKNAKPHLIMVLQDDLGHWDTAFNGNKKMKPVTKNVHAIFCSISHLIYTYSISLCTACA